MRRRPQLVSSYDADSAPFGSMTKRVWLTIGLAGLIVAPLYLTSELNALMATTFLAAIGAIGLNIVTGTAGQVSLGHAFFLGIGAYAGASLAGEPGASQLGLGLDMAIWLPAAGLMAALVGFVVAPLAARLRGLYLAIVTLGLVFVGEHIFRELKVVTGGAGIGRSAGELILFGVDLSENLSLGLFITDRTMNLYYLSFALLIVLAVVAKNLDRSAIGRALAAVRDRDAAAQMMGVALTRHKLIAFTLSSFYAGIAGAMLATVVGFIEPTGYGLFLSIEFLAMILIGGIGTVTGALMGAAFVTLLPRVIAEVPRVLPFVSGESTTDGALTVFQLETIIYGCLIVAFLILEPRGLFGLWVRMRNYFRAWPFSY